MSRIPGLIGGFALLGLTLGGVARGQDIRVETIVSGQPGLVAAVAAPGVPDVLYLVEQNGRVLVLDLGPNTIRTEPLLDISPSGASLTFASGERGLLGLAFDPDFAMNGHFYVNYTTASSSPLQTIVARFTDADRNDEADSTTPVVLKSFTQDFSNHNGGDLHFGPDGFLYVAVGDGGSFNDPFERGQNRLSLLGKMLRLDVDNAPTYIPANNPFIGDATTLDEIWALGLRNPWRFSFDRLTGDMWIGDVGQDAREEIDFQPALLPDNSNIEDVEGLNYGWDCREGFIASPFSDDDCVDVQPYTDPFIDVAHGSEGGCSITGGVVYRGSAIPELDGTYFYADYCGNWVRSFVPAGGVPTQQQDWTQLFGLGGGVVAFGEDNEGEVYLVDIGGSVSKIVPNDTVCGCPCILQGDEGLVFEDTFAGDLGWSVSGNATDGQWERAMPVNDPNYAFDPVTDGDGTGGFAYLTDNAPGASDVDGGETILMSPPLDLTVGAITICYQYFLNLTVAGGVDGIRVEISENGDSGPWVLIAEHVEDNDLFWTRHAIEQSKLDISGVTLTSDMRVRFRAQDLGGASTVEAGLDNFRVYSGNIPDCNGNGVDDAVDIAMGTSQDCNGDDVPDECNIAAGDLDDCAGGVLGDYDDGETFFTDSCIGCHGVAGLGGTGPNLRNVSRTTIKARLTFQIFHPGGQFLNATDDDFANIEAYLANGSSRARPDGIPDACQAGMLADCDLDGTPDACELEAGLQQDLNYDGVPDSCQTLCPGDLDGDGDTDVFDFNVFAANFGMGTPVRFEDGDFDGNETVDVFDFNIFAPGFGCDLNP